ncbi:MAG: hypothetical protein ACU85E_12580 [Gammaproteobacteria bacterium]
MADLERIILVIIEACLQRVFYLIEALSVWQKVQIVGLGNGLWWTGNSCAAGLGWRWPVSDASKLTGLIKAVNSEIKYRQLFSIIIARCRYYCPEKYYCHILLVVVYKWRQLVRHIDASVFSMILSH